MTTFLSYPRPMLRRDAWTSLDGEWEFAIDRDASVVEPTDVTWTTRILVPFAPETEASGVGDTGLYAGCWYRRTFECAVPAADQRVILHFGAVDYESRVWINGAPAGWHEGGYTSFSLDITGLLSPTGVQEVVVSALDDPSDLAKPRGKQDWQLEPHLIWYPRTTGIWQTVWFETVSHRRITSLQWAPDMRRWDIRFEAHVSDDHDSELRLRIRLEADGRRLADDTFSVERGEVARSIGLADPGIDDFRNELLWRPSRPTLIDAHVQLLSPDGTVLDECWSYTAMRSVQVEGDVFLLNGRPIHLRLVLDQALWPSSGMTPPDDSAYARDIELVQAMGFNGVRVHQKVESPRFLAEADRLGLLVWAEMPSAYRFTQRSVQRLVREWQEIVLRDLSHPCIITWVPFNESWGVPDLPGIDAQRQFVRTMYHLTRTLDPSRPVSGNDGWESTATDVIGIHDYDQDVDRLSARYASHEVLPHLFARERPAGRRLVLEELREHPILLSEFGGIVYTAGAEAEDENVHGYHRVDSADEFARRYTELMVAIRELPMLAGFCYTQLADTYQERNGLLEADRTPKIPLDVIAAATKRNPRWLLEDF